MERRGPDQQIGSRDAQPHFLQICVDLGGEHSHFARERLDRQDPWLQSLDLEYHNINPARGLFHALTPAKAIGEFNANAARPEATRTPPADTRAHGRGLAVALFQERQLPYVINWDSIAIESGEQLPMPDPFDTYETQVRELAE